MKENKLYTFGTLQKSHSLSSGISFQISPERTCRQSHSSNRGNYTKREIFIIKNNTSRNLKALTSKNNTSTNNEFKLPDIFLKSNSPFKLVKPKEKLLKGQNRLIFEHLKNKKKEERKKIKKIKILSPVKSTQSLSLLSDRLFDFKLERKLIGVTSKNIKLKNSILNGDWGLGIGDWGLGIGHNPQSPIPNPQSPIPMNKYNYSLINSIVIMHIYLASII